MLENDYNGERLTQLFKHGHFQSLSNKNRYLKELPKDL